MDIDNDGEITLEEFQRFWAAVKAAGHTEQEIMTELNNIETGESWVGFNDLPKVKALRQARLDKEAEDARKAAAQGGAGGAAQQ